MRPPSRSTRDRSVPLDLPRLRVRLVPLVLLGPRRLRVPLGLLGLCRLRVPSGPLDLGARPMVPSVLLGLGLLQRQLALSLPVGRLVLWVPSDLARRRPVQCPICAWSGSKRVCRWRARQRWFCRRCRILKCSRPSEGHSVCLVFPVLRVAGDERQHVIGVVGVEAERGQLVR